MKTGTWILIALGALVVVYLLMRQTTTYAAPAYSTGGNWLNNLAGAVGAGIGGYQATNGGQRVYTSNQPVVYVR